MLLPPFVTEATGAALADLIRHEVPKLGRAAGHLLRQAGSRSAHEIALLRSFGEDLLRDPPETTHSVDYVSWHEDDLDWRAGNGVLMAATFGEIPHIWTDQQTCVPYEARLRRFIKSGGMVQRVFVLKSELTSLDARRRLFTVLRRHQMLGFDPKVEIEQRAKRLFTVNCDTIACLNGRISYLVRTPRNEPPVMVRSTRPALSWRIHSQVQDIWDEAEPADRLFDRYGREELALVEEEAEAQARNVDNLERYEAERQTAV